MTDHAPRGHRVVEHTADQIIEAWGPTRAACLEEAVAAFVATFADTPSGTSARAETVELHAADDMTLLLEVLGEVVFLLDVENAVPVAVRVVDRDEHVTVHLELVDAGEVEATGPAPKGISHSGLDLSTADGDGWTARALIDI